MKRSVLSGTPDTDVYGLPEIGVATHDNPGFLAPTFGRSTEAMNLQSIVFAAAVALSTFVATLALVAPSSRETSAISDDRHAPHFEGIVGVLTPKFACEKSTSNVRDAVSRLQTEHAVAQDNSHGIMKAFRNQYWPAIYLIDKDGRMVYRHFGECGYRETKGRIQAFLGQPSTQGSAT